MSLDDGFMRGQIINEELFEILSKLIIDPFHLKFCIPDLTVRPNCRINPKRFVLHDLI